jgi:integrase
MPVPLSSNVPSPGAGSAPGQPPKLLDRLRDAIRVRHYSLRTEEAYAAWVRRFILFHGKRHPLEMGAAEINAFRTHLAVDGHVSASTQELLGHKDMSTTRISTHVLNLGGRGVRSPLDKP